MQTCNQIIETQSSLFWLKKVLRAQGTAAATLPNSNSSQRTELNVFLGSLFLLSAKQFPLVNSECRRANFFWEQELHPSSESLTADLLVSKTEPHKWEPFSSPTIFSGWVSSSSVPPALHFVHKAGNNSEL